MNLTHSFCKARRGMHQHGQRLPAVCRHQGVFASAPLSAQPAAPANALPEVEVEVDQLSMLKAKTDAGATKWTAGGSFGAAVQ